MITIAQIESAILAMIRFPTFLVDSDAKILYSNAAGTAALTEQDCFRTIANFLLASESVSTSRLKGAIASVCADGDIQTLVMNGRQQRSPYLVRVIPFEDADTSEKSNAIVFLQSFEPAGFAKALKQLFRLSAAETEIAMLLTSGIDVASIAEMRQAKITTVRTQIAAMLLKTRMRRQGEMCALFSRICSLP